MTESFVMFAEQWPAIALLSSEQRAVLLQAVFAHHGACPMPEMDTTTQAIFLMMKPRFDANKAKYEQKRETLRENGLKGGRPRKDDNQKVDCEEPENHLLLDEKQKSLLVPLPVPVPVPELKTPPSPSQGGGEVCAPVSAPRRGKQPAEYSAAFEAFWHEYPRKIGKDAAWKVYKRRKHEMPKGEGMAAILARHSQTEQWQREGGQFIPHPATWLNQGRWADDVETCGQAPQDPVGW